MKYLGRGTYDGSQEEPIVGRLDDPLWVVEATYHRSLHRPSDSYKYWADGSWGKVDKERVWWLLERCYGGLLRYCQCILKGLGWRSLQVMV